MATTRGAARSPALALAGTRHPQLPGPATQLEHGPSVGVDRAREHGVAARDPVDELGLALAVESHPPGLLAVGTDGIQQPAAVERQLEVVQVTQLLEGHAAVP